MNNGDWTKWALRWLVGVIWAVIFFSVTFIGKNVIANDQASRARDSAIRKEVNGVQQTLAAQTVELRYLGKIVEKNGSNQEKILEILKDIKNE